MVGVLLLCLLGVVTLLYLWLSRHYSYWSRQGVVQPPTLPVLGNMLPAVLNRSNVGLILDEMYRRYHDHDAVGVYSLLTPKLLIRNPRLIQKVLISDFSSFHDNDFYVDEKLDPLFALDPFCLKGEEWKPVRAKLVSTLTLGKLKEIFPLMKDIIPRLDSYLEEQSGKNIEAKELSTLFTMDNVSNCVFGISSDCFKDSGAAFRRMADDLMKDTLQSWWRMLIVHLMPTVQSLFSLRFIPTPVSDFIERIVGEVFEHRMKNNVVRNDLFQLFIKKAQATDNPGHEMLFFGSTYFLEGFETSAMVASGVLYELALNPGVQQRLREEVVEVLGHTYDPDFDTLNSLTYLDNVIQESQRKYPIMYTLNRSCTRTSSLEIDGRTVQVQAGTPVMLPVFSIHRDPRYYPDPERFDPERFSEENKGSRTPCTFLPFGDGPRMCPGVKFGLIQVKLLISFIVYKYIILKCDQTPDTLTLASGSFMVVSNEGKWIRIDRRT